MYGETRNNLADGYTCTASSGETCTLYCNQKDEAKNDIISCGNAGTCEIYCTAETCFDGATINAYNANTFRLIQNSGAESCLEDATINLPTNGNAYLIANSGADKPFEKATINGGSDGSNIEITVNSGVANTDAFKDAEIYASDADTLIIEIAGSQEFDAKIVECPDYPRNAAYDGPLMAP